MSQLDNFDDSSAGETPKSPEQDEKTPDTMGRSMLEDTKPTASKSYFSRALQPWDGNMGSQNQNVQAGAERERGSPVKEKERPLPSARRESFFGKMVKKFHSPGRGEIPRGSDHERNMEKRISKRRRDRDLQRQVSRRRRRSVSDSDQDSPRKASWDQNGAQDASNKPHWISSAFTFIAQHPTVPHILSFYAQLVFNIFLLAGCAYLIYCFWSAVSGDVDKKSFEAMADIMAEMAACAEQYTANKCDRSTRAPALETVCENWSKCMNRDPNKVGRARVSAHTFAEIFNSFVEPISWKAMIFTLIVVFGCFASTNLVFGFFRDKTNQYYNHHQPPPYYNHGPPPPTPHRSFSNENPGAQYYGTPWSAMPALEPQPSQGFAQIEGRGSPVRRLVYN